MLKLRYRDAIPLISLNVSSLEPDCIITCIFCNAFIRSLSINGKKFNEKIKYNEIPEWDSIGHMTLMSGLEEVFSITMDTDDIVDFSSFNKGFEILGKYGVKF